MSSGNLFLCKMSSGIGAPASSVVSVNGRRERNWDVLRKGGRDMPVCQHSVVIVEGGRLTGRPARKSVNLLTAASLGSLVWINWL